MKRRLTLRDETGRAILNCYACKTEGRMICDYFSCQQRLIERLADFEDAESREGKSVEVKDGKIVRISKNELQRRYFDGEYYMAMPFCEYVTRFEIAGCEVVDDDGLHENNAGQV